MIYFIYCFSYFINDEEYIPADNTVMREAENNSIENVNDFHKDSIKFRKEQDGHHIEPKPIVSSSPKPIVLENNIISNKIKKVNDINPIISTTIDSTDKNEDNEKPKITLKLNEMMICRGIYKRNPIKPGIKFINNVDSLFCYTKISNSGNKQEVKHRWYFENKEVTTVSYNIKTSYNYRSWSKKTIYPNQTGKWRVDVVDKFGFILGSREFLIQSINTTY